MTSDVAQVERDAGTSINYEGFAKDMDALRKRAFAELSEHDLRFLKRIEIVGKLSTFLGLATAWIVVNPISIFLLSNGIITRWLMMHHIGHGGYDKVPGVPARYTSKKFALGWRRYLDWFDWIIPEAWNCEHNILHHYHTGELADPDLVEEHADFLRKKDWPKPIQYLALMLFGVSWKFVYYAPNTISGLTSYRSGTAKQQHQYLINLSNWWDLRNPLVRTLWRSCYLPYFSVHFLLVPSLFLPLGTSAALTYLVSRVLAEMLTNFHTYMIIAPNHCGEDLCRFDTHFKGKQEFYVNQVIGTVNYRTGSLFSDYTQMWLNYQIEHHLIPDLPMTAYARIQPEVEALCKKHGVPYVQESVFKRFRKFIAICVGDAQMIRVTSRDSVAALSS